MDMVPMDSTSIAAAGYDACDKVLRIRFVNGRTYDYRGVPPHVFAAFEAADSKGRFVNFDIKPHYPYQRLPD